MFNLKKRFYLSKNKKVLKKNLYEIEIRLEGFNVLIPATVSNLYHLYNQLSDNLEKASSEEEVEKLEKTIKEQLIFMRDSLDKTWNPINEQRNNVSKLLKLSIFDEYDSVEIYESKEKISKYLQELDINLRELSKLAAFFDEKANNLME